MAQVMRTIPVVETHQNHLFELLWDAGIPLIVKELKNHRPELWHPNIFMRSHEHDSVEILLQTSAGTRKENTTLEHLFELLHIADKERTSVVKLKVHMPRYIT